MINPNLAAIGGIAALSTIGYLALRFGKPGKAPARDLEESSDYAAMYFEAMHKKAARRTWLIMEVARLKRNKKRHSHLLPELKALTNGALGASK